MAHLDPRGLRILVANSLDWDSTQPGKMSDEQLTYFEEVLRDNADARWIFISMHMPLWQGDHQAWRGSDGPQATARITRSRSRPQLQAEHIDGNSHVRLGPTGGLWVLGGPEGTFDHVTQVTVADRGPVVTNILLDGVARY